MLRIFLLPALLIAAPAWGGNAKGPEIDPSQMVQQTANEPAPQQAFPEQKSADQDQGGDDLGPIDVPLEQPNPDIEGLAEQVEDRRAQVKNLLDSMNKDLQKMDLGPSARAKLDDLNSRFSDIQGPPFSSEQIEDLISIPAEAQDLLDGLSRLNRADAVKKWIPRGLGVLALLGFLVLGAYRWLGKKASHPEKHPGSGPLAEALARKGTSDRPLNLDDIKGTRLVSYTKAVAEFIMNKDTQPPLTFAVTGEWGIGKSSFLSMVGGHLRDNGLRPVWFNAWHHQDEKSLLASLFEAVKSQAVPPIYTLEGLKFRLMLLFKRTDHFIIPGAMAILAVLGAVVTFQLDILDEDFWTSAAVVFAILTALFGRKPLRALTVYGLDTSKLIGVGRQAMSLKTFSGQAGFRHQFGEAFREASQALGTGRLVVLVDDLDRYDPEQVVDILESMNFLTSQGECYFLLGLDPEWLRACVGLRFQNIAREVAGLENSNGNERAVRQEFAASYLEKLINIEIPVPKIELGELLSKEKEEDVEALKSERRRAQWRRRIRYVSQVFPAFLLFASFSMLMVGFALDGTAPRPSEASPAAEALERPQDAPNSTEAAAAGRENQKSENSREKVLLSSVNVGDSSVPLLLLVIAGVGVLFIFSAAAGTTISRVTVARIEDSAAVRAALNYWSRFAFLYKGTPRSMKRFNNRVRFLAMLESIRQTQIKDAQSLSPTCLVATTAIQHYDPKLMKNEAFWKEIDRLVKKNQPVKMNAKMLTEQAMGVLLKIIMLLKKDNQLPEDFPPPKETRQRFAARASRIRV